MSSSIYAFRTAFRAALCLILAGVFLHAQPLWDSVDGIGSTGYHRPFRFTPAPSFQVDGERGTEQPAATGQPGPAEQPDEAKQPAASDEPQAPAPAEVPLRASAESAGAAPRTVLFQDQHVRSGESPQDVVTVRGNALNEGIIRGDFVTVFGSSENRGAVFGDYVTVFGSAIAGGGVQREIAVIFGSLDLATEAPKSVVVIGGDVRFHQGGRVNGDLIAIGGRISTPNNLPTSNLVGGELVNIRTPFGRLFDGPMARYFSDCVLLLRPVSPTLVFSLVCFTVFAVVGFLIYLPAGRIREKSHAALAERPIAAFFTGALLLLGMPFFLVLLIATGVGILLLPVVFLLLTIWFLLGRAVVSVALGQRLLRGLGIEAPHVAAGFLVGTLLLLVLFCVPFLGLSLALVLWTLELGVAFLGTIGTLRANRSIPPPAAPVAPAPEPAPAPAAAAFQAAPAPAPSQAAPAATAGFAAPGPSPAPAPASEPLFGAAAPAVPPAEPATAADWGLPPNPPPPPPAATPPPPPPPAPAAPALLARLGPRSGAFFVDLLLCVVLANVFNTTGAGLLIVLVVYTTAMIALRSTTLGGIIFGVEVARMDERPMDGTTALVRALASVLSFVPLGLGYWWAFWDANRQTWHDKLAGTQAVERRSDRGLV